MQQENPDGDPLVSRAQGCLFGQYIGDALGTRYEFKRQENVEGQVAADLNPLGFLPILGGGPFNLKPGDVTDDTELAMALARSLLDKKTYNPAAVAYAYRQWIQSGPFDVGVTTQNALTIESNVTSPKRVLQTILQQARERNEGSLSNGCLMRVSPLAIAAAKWRADTLVLYAKLDAQLTNPHVDAQVAVAAYTAAVAELIRSGDTKAAFQRALEVARESTLVTLWLRAAERKRVEVSLTNGAFAKHDGTHMGYVGIAFQWAFSEMLYSSTFEEGLVRVVARGGDTDTNGCICGAMLGARFGVDAIPEEWKVTVSTCERRRVNAYPWVDSTDVAEVAQRLLDTMAPAMGDNSAAKHAKEDL